jgi:protein-S-isoprenylcysteine O-methyltransferase Ste14
MAGAWPAFTTQPRWWWWVFSATVLIWPLLEGRQSLHRRQDAAYADRGRVALVPVVGAAALLLALAALSVQRTRFELGVPARIFALALLWAGLALRSWCFRTLGEYFTLRVMTSETQTVVDSGPYAVLRHPSYAALLLILGGLGVAFGNWLSLLALILPSAAGIVVRIRVEEAALTAALGDRYRDYARGRSRLIPLVW